MSSRTVLSTSCCGHVASATGIFKAGSVRSDRDGSLPRPAKLFDPEPFRTTDYASGVKKPRRRQMRQRPASSRARGIVPACPARCLRWSPNVQMPAPSGTRIGAVSSAVRGVEALFPLLLTASLLSVLGIRTEFACINHTHCGHARRLVGGVSRTKVPGVRALLCKSGLGLKLQGRIRNALISPVLSFDQVFGCTVLEQASRFETDGACVGMTSYVLNHNTPGCIPDASRTWEFRTCVGIFELRSG
jgi:hypothetical protein